LKHVSFDEIAQVPKERRRFGWVAVRLVRSTGRGRKTWEPLYVIGFFPSRDDALEFIGEQKATGVKYGVCPFDDASEIG
jgi:hypothetical protein